MRAANAFVIGLIAVAAASGCQDDADDGIGIEATGAVNGVVWLDGNGNGLFDSTDGRIRDVRVDLVLRTGGSALYSAESGPAGELIFPSVMVGDYRADPDTGSVGDTLNVLRVDSADLTVAANDTPTVVVGLTYPHVTVEGARAAPLDRKLFVEGVVISRWNTYRDGTLHVRDTTGALRSLRVQPTGAALGDEVRLLGTTSVQAGRSVLKDVFVFPVETGVDAPDPVTADAGRLDAELVRVVDAIIQDTLRNSLNEVVIRVDDGSGALDLVLDRDIGFALGLPRDSVIGTSLEATGILLPPASAATDSWVVKPRGNADIVVNE